MTTLEKPVYGVVRKKYVKIRSRHLLGNNSSGWHVSQASGSAQTGGCPVGALSAPASGAVVEDNIRDFGKTTDLAVPRERPKYDVKHRS